MPFSSSGVYELPSTYRGTPLTTIKSTEQHNSVLEDIRDALSATMIADGRKAFTAPVNGVAGTGSAHFVTKAQLDAAVFASASPSYADDAEALAGTEAAKAISPARLKTVNDALQAEIEAIVARPSKSGGRVNLFNNPTFWLSQRYGSTSVTASATIIYYPVDRWLVRLTTTSVGTLTGQRVIDGDGDYTFRITRSSGAYAGQIWSGQVFEERAIQGLRAGGDVTLSMTVTTGTAFNGTPALVMVASPATGQTSDNVFISGWTTETRTTVALSTLPPGAPGTTAKRYEHTFTVPAGTKSLYFGISTGNFTGSGSANDWISFKLPQLEYGDSASEFEYPDEHTDRLECYRYCYVVEAVSANFVGYGHCSGTTSFRVSVPTPVPMRSEPTITTTAGNTRVYCNGTTITPSSIASPAEGYCESCVTITGTMASGGSANHAATFLLTSGNTLRLDAEI